MAAALLLAVPPALAQEGTPAHRDPDMRMSATGMAGLYGPYDMGREGSGTSWQPDSTPMQGLHQTSGQWMGMVHGFIDAIYDDQGGPRGDSQSFSTSMLMLMARRDLPDAALGLRFMVSADPLMGKEGYPLLFQTGETADGHTPLIDRQHPHDLIMEAALSYSVNLSPLSAVFVYAGLPGEPALGPDAFMHRLSGIDNPEAPLTHHWLDSTHISWGVLTAGYSLSNLRLEASAFNGREPDQDRYNIELRPLDSWSARLSYNPTRDWSLQGSYGYLASPEQLEPQISVRRTTASASYNAPATLWWQTTLAWGRNDPSAGAPSNAWLLESAAQLARVHTVFGRLERVDKDELFLPGSPLFGRSFTINALTLGYVYDFAHLEALRFGVGGLVSFYNYPRELDAAYGESPVSFMVFVRARL
jgi:hypothetical protein